MSELGKSLTERHEADLAERRSEYRDDDGCPLPADLRKRREAGEDAVSVAAEARKRKIAAGVDAYSPAPAIEM